MARSCQDPAGGGGWTVSRDHDGQPEALGRLAAATWQLRTKGTEAGGARGPA